MQVPCGVMGAQAACSPASRLTGTDADGGCIQFTGTRLGLNQVDPLATDNDWSIFNSLALTRMPPPLGAGASSSSSARFSAVRALRDPR